MSRVAVSHRGPASLRLRLLLIIGLSIGLLWSAVAAWLLVDMQRSLRRTLDDRLAASATMVAGLVAQLGAPQALQGPPGVSPLDVMARDGLACEVSTLRGEVTAQTVARTAHSPGLAAAQPGYADHVLGGRRWRTYVLVQDGVRIATADRSDVRDALLRQMAWSMALPMLVALAGSMLLLWFGIRHGLRPLDQIRALLARREPGDATPLPAIAAPAELQPLMSALRALLARVGEALESERRFTDAAAHELRTPLTAIKTHLQVAGMAARQPEARPALAQALQSAEHGISRLHGTLEQLLLLARLDGQSQAHRPASAETTADIATAVRMAVEDVCTLPGAVARLEVHGVQDAAGRPLALPLPLVVAALRNLLHNALTHAPAPSSAVLHMEQAGPGRICFVVLDDGPGLDAEDCARAAQRFWRRGAGSTGSGLGLAIVHAIAQGHGGTLRLQRRSAAGGLVARLCLPLALDRHDRQKEAGMETT